MILALFCNVQEALQELGKSASTFLLFNSCNAYDVGIVETDKSVL
jgi:hypothetical protein